MLAAKQWSNSADMKKSACVTQPSSPSSCTGGVCVCACVCDGAVFVHLRRSMSVVPGGAEILTVRVISVHLQKRESS